MSWRLTFIEPAVPITEMVGINADTGLVVPGTTLKAIARVELRDEEGQIVRLAMGSEFAILESPMGQKPEYFGEVAILAKGNCGKYRTSCWNGFFGPTQRPDIFWRPSSTPNTDEVFAVKGDLIIYEFDENRRPFSICVVCEGQKGIITYDSGSALRRDKYTSQVLEATEDEYRYILDNYLDSRKWR
jgi:hypothetical protein